MPKVFIPVGLGILEPKHVSNIGPSVWLFLWMIRRTTAEVSLNGITWGLVLGGRPICFSYISRELGIPIETLKDHADILEAKGYLKSLLVSGIGLRYCIKNSQRRFLFKRQAEEVINIVLKIVNKFSTEGGLPR